jgi:hypothetical protein
MTAIGPVDILARDHARQHVAIEIKRRGEIDGVEQLTRYLDLMNRDPTSRRSSASSPRRRSSRRRGSWPRTEGSAAWFSTTTR